MTLSGSSIVLCVKSSWGDCSVEAVAKQTILGCVQRRAVKGEGRKEGKMSLVCRTVIFTCFSCVRT